MADAQYFELCSLVIVRLVNALHGTVMNTMPPSCKREVRTEVLIDMMADLNLSCPRKNPGIFTSTLAWSGSVPHNMSPWSLQNGRPEALIDNDRTSSDHCYVCTVWLRDEHGTTMIVEGCIPEVAVHMMGPFHFFFCEEVRLCTITTHALSRQVMTTTQPWLIFSMCTFDGLDGWYLEVFFVRSGSCRCYVWIVWYRDEHHANGDRHDGSHPRALSVTLPLIVAWLQNKSQCWTLLYLFCMVLWWTPYHHDLWGTRSPKRLVVMSIVVIGLCGLVIHIHSHDTWWTLTPEVSVVMMAVVLCFFVQLNRPPSSMREICSVWSRDVNIFTWTCERFSKTDGGWNGGISPGVFSVTVQVSVLYVIVILERRCEQVPVMNIDIFALYGLVMNLTPPWSLRDVASETLFDMIFLKCSWRALLHLFCVVSWWRYHHDSCISHSWCALFSWRKPIDFFTACVSLCGFLINTSHCDVSRTLVSIPPTFARYPLTNDNRHGGSHLRVSWVTEPVVQASSLTLWDFLFARRLQLLSSFRLHFLVPWWTSFHQDMVRIVCTMVRFDMDFLCAKRCQRRSLRYLHSVVLWYAPITMTLAGRLFRNLGWHDCFVSSVLIVKLSSRSSCVRNVRTWGEHHTTMRESRAPRSLETREGRSPVSFSEKEAPVIISAFSALYGPVTNTLPFFESSLLRVIVKVFLFVTGSQTQSFFFFRAVCYACTHLSPSFEGLIWRKFIRDVFALCGLVMFSVPRGSVRGSHERMVTEIMAALQMSLCVTAPAIVLLLHLERDVVSRPGRWTLQGWFTMVLWWTPYLYDFRGSHSPMSLGWHSDCFRCACFFKASQRLSLQLLHCVVSGYTHTSHCHIWRYIVQTCWCAHGGPSDDPCYVHAVCFLWWTPYHQDLRGPRWQMMIGMVEAIHVSFHLQSQSSPLCWKQLHFGTVQFSDENRPHHQDFWRTFAHEFGWHGVFLFVKRCQRRSLRYLHSVVLWYTPLAFTLVRRFLRILGGILFSCLVCAAEQSFVLLLQCVVFWRTS